MKYILFFFLFISYNQTYGQLTLNDLFKLFTRSDDDFDKFISSKEFKLEKSVHPQADYEDSYDIYAKGNGSNKIILTDGSNVAFHYLTYETSNQKEIVIIKNDLIKEGYKLKRTSWEKGKKIEEYFKQNNSDDSSINIKFYTIPAIGVKKWVTYEIELSKESN